MSLKAFDIGGILNTPASDFHVRLKTTYKAILKKLQETQNSVKQLQRQQFSFTKTSIEIKVSLKILSHVLTELQHVNNAYFCYKPAFQCWLFFEMNSRQENSSKLSF